MENNHKCFNFVGGERGMEKRVYWFCEIQKIPEEKRERKKRKLVNVKRRDMGGRELRRRNLDMDIFESWS